MFVHTGVGKDRGPFQMTLDDNNSIVILDGDEEKIWSAEEESVEGSENTMVTLQDDGTIWVVDEDTDTVLWSTRGAIQLVYFIDFLNDTLLMHR